jgi:hypothetical protein
MFSRKTAIVLLLFANLYATSQTNTSYFKDAIAANRLAFKNKVLKQINKCLPLAFSEENESSFNNFFYNCNLLHIIGFPTLNKFKEAAAKLSTLTEDNQMAFLDAANNLYPNLFNKEVESLFYVSTNYKVKAMAAHCLLAQASAAQKEKYLQHVKQLPIAENDLLKALYEHIDASRKKANFLPLTPFFDKDYLPNELLVISIQRKNRNYPGLALVRLPNGQFLKNKDGSYFSVGQLARSLSNMPCFISNGNTPQGIFKITGIDTSKNYFIGPTPNLQLAMPFEYYRDSINGILVDTSFSEEMYKSLLPNSFRNHKPLYESLVAGKIGRTEIIAHGTTVDVSYYTGKPYYPFTPTMGCLATCEIWNSRSGFLQTSGQLDLATAVIKTGTTKGYLIVVEINDINKPVTIGDVKPFLGK